MKLNWRDGNRLELLENGEAFFPAVIAAVDAAEREVVIETFILFDDKVGQALHRALLDAAKRGVSVDLTVDGYGSPDLGEAFVKPLTDAGVRFHVYSPQPPFLGIRVNPLRRLHRKIVVVDGKCAFVGGINYSADHLGDFGPMAKQDYSVRVEGPLVDDIHRFALDAIAPVRPRRWWRPKRPRPLAKEARPLGSVRCAFVSRDNDGHHDDIERCYRAGIRGAKREVIIANAYFFPGYRLLRELRRAAKRGVRVVLILQGEPDMPIVRTAAELLYESLVRAGVEIHEYCRRPLHGKVAVIDGHWATVGSSNLDPLSLSLNLEANILMLDPEFAGVLKGRLEHLIAHECSRIDAASLPAPSWWTQLRTTLVFHVLRRFPRWLRWVPSPAAAIHSMSARGDVMAPAHSATARAAAAADAASVDAPVQELAR